MQVVNKARIPNGLAPINMNADGTFARSGIRLGSNGDSYYEYLLKQYIQTNRTEPVYLQMYADAMQGVHENLVFKTPRDGLTYIAELLPQAGGEKDWKTCVECFFVFCFEREEETRRSEKRKRSAGEESIDVADPPKEGERDWYIKGANKEGSPLYDVRYMLRPEISESVFLAWRLTGDARYRSYAWDIFSAIERHCRLPGGGYATVLDVDNLPVSYLDKQETFFLSETLKYLYLTFADENVLDLNEVVFNTEAHPLPIFNPSIKPLFTKYS
ncbi:alpha-1,2-Mannosidase [Mycena venus]|uniref:alpha-1,2-Mannosidase n=1 Tax=Mycena venus TaxID=2733690 RepID=A0A8H6XE79_9AGAR|nr:alpha-1,2-Mannosidase [Mycena venus]